jgi:hypothetical protein
LNLISHNLNLLPFRALDKYEGFHGSNRQRWSAHTLGADRDALSFGGIVRYGNPVGNGFGECHAPCMLKTSFVI